MEAAKEVAAQKEKKNNEKFHHAKKMIADYCKQEGLIISDVGVLLGKDSSLKTSIYCNNPIRHARGIANYLYSVSKWVKMTTVVEDEEASVYFNAELLASVFVIKKHRDLNMKELISPVMIHDLQYIPPELELIDAYQGLYKATPEDDPGHEELIKMVFSRIENKVIGGDDCNDCKKKRRSGLENLKSMVFEHFGKSHVVVGHWAVGKGKKHTREKLQLISGDVIQSIKDVTEFLQKYTQFEVTYKENSLHIPKDFRTRRYILSIQYPSINNAKPTKKPFLDIFNSGEFELVPYIAGSVNIGSSYVLLRFMLIDLWIVRLVKRLGVISADVLDEKMGLLVNSMEGAMKVGDPTEYFGVWKEYSVEKKIEGLKKRMHYPYYPHKNK